MRDEIIAGLDIGSTAIRLVIGQKVEGNEKEDLQIIGAVSVPAKGVNKGIVTSIEDTTSSISACLEKAERLIGVPINSVWVSINDPYIRCTVSRGVVAVGKTDGEVGDNDTARAIEAARALAVPANYEILHVIPIKYTIDNQEGIKDPIGMSGIRLEVEALIVQGLSTQIKNLTKAIYRTGLDIEDLILSPLASAEAVLGYKQKELGVALINIGSSTTNLSIYEDGDLLHAAVLPLGSEHITSDIAIGLRCPINLAERIKIEYGNSDPSNFTKREEIDVTELVKEEEINDKIDNISRKYVAEIIEARVEEIFKKVDEEITKVERSGMLPAGVLLVGGGAKLNGIIDSSKKYLRLPSGLGMAKNINVIIDKVHDPEFLTALGLVVWGNNSESSEKKGKQFKNNITDLLQKIKGLFKRIMP